jgi:hypothetical protein
MSGSLTSTSSSCTRRPRDSDGGRHAGLPAVEVLLRAARDVDALLELAPVVVPGRGRRRSALLMAWRPHFVAGAAGMRVSPAHHQLEPRPGRARVGARLSRQTLSPHVRPGWAARGCLSLGAEETDLPVLSFVGFTRLEPR